MHVAEMIRSGLTEEARSGIAESICEAPAKTRHLAEFGAGLLLAGLAEMSSLPQGGRAIARALAEEDTVPLENLAETLRGSQANVCMERGAGEIIDLLGGDFMECCGRLLSTYSGVGVGAAKSLISLLMPVVLTALKQSVMPVGSADAEAVRQALDAQRSSIASLLPDDFDFAQSAQPRLQRCGIYLQRPPAEATGESMQPPPSAALPHPLLAFLSRLMPVLLIGLVVLAVAERYIVVHRLDRMKQTSAVVRAEARPAASASDHAMLVAARLGPSGMTSASPAVSVSAADPALLAMLDSVRASLLHLQMGGAAGTAALVEMQVYALSTQRKGIEEKSLLDWRSRRQGLEAVSSQARQLAHNLAQVAQDQRLAGALGALEQELGHW